MADSADDRKSVIQNKFRPTMLERSIGRTLAGWRRDRGLSLAETSKRVHFSTAKISMMENAIQPSAPVDIMALGHVYGTPVRERQSVAELAEYASVQRTSNRSDDPTLFDPATDIVGLYAETVRLRSFSGAAIPAILQTHGYALAVLNADDPLRAPVKAEQQRSATQAWQARIREREPLVVETVVIETAIGHVVGNPETMRGQLEFLIELSRRPNVTIQVIMHDAAATCLAARLPFAVLSFPHQLHDDVVYVESSRRSGYVEDRRDVKRCTETFTILQELALSPGHSADYISTVAHRLRAVSV